MQGSSRSSLHPFHLALPVDDLAAAEAFYCGMLGFAKGRAASRWLDLDFHGRQATMFFVDPAGNTLEFKRFSNPAQLLATWPSMPVRRRCGRSLLHR